MLNIFAQLVYDHFSYSNLYICTKNPPKYGQNMAKI